MTYRDRLFFWLLGGGTLCLFIYSVSGILLPFVVAIIAAYFLNPAAARLQKIGFSRGLATASITISFFVAVIAATVMLAPIFYEQLGTFLTTVPSYITYVNKNIVPAFSNILKTIDPHAIEKAQNSIGDASGYTIKFLGTVVTNLLNSGIAVLNILSLLFITPVVTFYMLRDWDKIINKLNSWLPPRYAEDVRGQAREIDRILAGYLRGQIHVCFIIGVFYAIALTMAGLEFSVFIGIATGLLLFIPYVGSLFGFTIGIIVAFFQFGDMQHLAIIAAIFLAGQVLEGVFITPSLVGNKVGLHPVWIMFGLLAGGAMFGFVGVLLALPVTAVIGVIVRFFIGQYSKKVLGDKAVGTGN